MMHFVVDLDTGVHCTVYRYRYSVHNKYWVLVKKCIFFSEELWDGNKNLFRLGKSLPFLEKKFFGAGEKTRSRSKKDRLRNTGAGIIISLEL